MGGRTGTVRQVVSLAAAAALGSAITALAVAALRDEPAIEGARRAVIRSGVLGEDREHFVLLPQGYDADAPRRYPVLYVLDGAAQAAHTAESAALLSRIGLAPPVLVVGVPSVDGETRNRDYTPPGMPRETDERSGPTGAADRFLAHIESELIPAIEREYRTTRPRVLAGWSRGGLFAVYSAIARPALFDARFAHSPALWRENDRIVAELEQALKSPSAPGGFLYLSLGDQENDTMTAAYRGAVAMLERGAPPSLRWRADLSAGGTHESNPRLSAPVGLCALFDATGRACAPAPAGSFEAR